MSLQDLLSMEVTSVTKSAQSLRESAAAVFVMDSSEIRQTGASSIPELLRHVPGMHVGQIDGNRWAVSSRGFQGLYANKLLVLIDGRSVYSPLFGGVHWDMVDTVFSDIERIEVIRGPGGSLWGANAVNGVVNIITSRSDKNHGTRVNARFSDAGQVVTSARTTFRPTDKTSARVYGKYRETEHSEDEFGADTRDGYRLLQLGTRIDHQFSNTDELSISADVIGGANERVNTIVNVEPFSFTPDFSDAEFSTYNVNVLWKRELSAESRLEVRTYLDHTDREEVAFKEVHDVFAFNIEHFFRATAQTEISWGAGYRSVKDDIDGGFSVAIVPDSESHDVMSAFGQAQWKSANEMLSVTAGTKFEHNEYTGDEFQPTIRFGLNLGENFLWSSYSRAVRTPTRFDRDVRVRALFQTGPSPQLVSFIGGGAELESESVKALEVGLRRSFAQDRIQVDIALYRNSYDKLMGLVPGAPRCYPTSAPPPCLSANSQALEFPQSVANLGSNVSTVGELVVDWRVTDRWRLRSVYSYLNSEGRQFTFPSSSVGPEHQAALEVHGSLSDSSELSVSARYVDPSNQLPFDESVAINIKWAWQINDQVQFSLIGRNLFEDGRVEFKDSNAPQVGSIVEQRVAAEIQVSF